MCVSPLQQDVLKPVRCFLVNITSVTLMGQAQQGVYPHTNGGQTAVTVCVMQDVVNRGQLNFNAVLVSCFAIKCGMEWSLCHKMWYGMEPVS